MALGVAREGSEPSLFYDLRLSDDGRTLFAAGWFLHKELPDTFELEVWEDGDPEPVQVARYIATFKPDQSKKIIWKHPLELEINRALRPDED
jgi:hypothetical protein